MTVSQEWLTKALASSVEGPSRTDRVAMWVAGHYPTHGNDVRFELSEVKDSIRCRSYTVVIKALEHLQNDGLLEVSVRSDGLHYCVTSSHLIDRNPNTTETTCRCDTKCDRSEVGERTHYSDTDTPLKGSMYLVASHSSATVSGTRKGDTRYENYRKTWALWKELKLGSSKSGRVARNQGQSEESIKRKAEQLVDKYGWPLVERIIHAEAADAKSRGWSYNFARFIRSQLEGLIQDALEATETGQESTNGGRPVSGVIEEIDRLVTGNEALSSIKDAYHVDYVAKPAGGIDWVWKAGTPESYIREWQMRIDSAKRMSTFGITIVTEDAE